MKKSIVLLSVMLFLFAMTGCAETEIKQPETKPESLVGYIVIEGDTLYFDEVEIVEMEDKERVSELGLRETDMPNGYTIINENREEASFELADDIKYTFTDLDLYFVKEAEGNRLYTTTKKDEFIKHLGKLNDSPLSAIEVQYPFCWLLGISMKNML